VELNMKGTNAGKSLTCSQWAGASVCLGVIPNHSSNVSAWKYFARSSEAKGQPLTIFKLCLCPVEQRKKRLADRAGRGYASPYRLQHIRQAITG